MPAGLTKNILCFRLKGRQLGIDTDQAKMIMGHQSLTPLPQSPAHIVGILGFNGRAIALIDLASFLQIGDVSGEEARDDSDILNRIVVASAGDMTAAFSVDAVLGVTDLSKYTTREPRFSHEGRLRDFVETEYVDDDEIVAVLNTALLFNEARL